MGFIRWFCKSFYWWRTYYIPLDKKVAVWAYITDVKGNRYIHLGKEIFFKTKSVQNEIVFGR